MSTAGPLPAASGGGAVVPDTLSRFVVEGAAVRGVRVRLAATTRAILAAHPYPPALARVLAELCAAAALLAATLKFDGTLILQLAGDGPVRLLVVECNHALALRAMAQWDEARVAALGERATLADLAGNRPGTRLSLTLDPRQAGPMYQGIVALESASVAALIEHYLTASEQVVSRLVLEVEGGTASGLLLQRLPASGPADDAVWDRSTRRLAAADRAAIGRAAAGDAGLAALLPDDDLRVFSAVHPHFACSCSQARVDGALRIAGRDEIEAALADAGHVEVTCEFCGRNYRYDAPAARALFAVAASASIRH